MPAAGRVAGADRQLQVPLDCPISFRFYLSSNSTRFHELTARMESMVRREELVNFDISQIKKKISFLKPGKDGPDHEESPNASEAHEPCFKCEDGLPGEVKRCTFPTLTIFINFSLANLVKRQEFYVLTLNMTASYLIKLNDFRVHLAR